MRFVATVLLLCSCLFLFGCDSDIAYKINQKATLTTDEQARYNKEKEKIDQIAFDSLSAIADKIMEGNEGSLTSTSAAELVGSRKVVDTIIANKLKVFAQKVIADADLSDSEKKIKNRYLRQLKMEIIPQIKAELLKKQQIVYKRKNGKVAIFDVSDNVFQKYSFRHGDTISTQWGIATVIGIFEDKLWFQLDKVNGATYWTDIDDSFKLIKSTVDNITRAITNRSALESESSKQSKRATQSVSNVQPVTKNSQKEEWGSGTVKSLYFKKLPSLPPLEYDY